MTSFEYDDADRLQSTIDAEGRETKLTYYGDGQVDETIQVVVGSDVVVGKNTYTANGRLDTVMNAETHVTTFGYDAFDRLHKTTWPDLTFDLVQYGE